MLPLDMNIFIKRFFGMITSIDFSRIPNGKLDAERMQIAFGYMMSDKHPDLTNEQAFYAFLLQHYGIAKAEAEPLFLDFYQNDFDALASTAGQQPISRQVVDILKAKGYTLVLATNPAFPKIATHKRMAWAGLTQADFVYITTFENAHFVKPHLAYYTQILDTLNLNAEQCYMVGNNIKEDLCAVNLGMDAFLLTEYLIGDINEAPTCEKGNYLDLKKWAEKLPPV